MRYVSVRTSDRAAVERRGEFTEKWLVVWTTSFDFATQQHVSCDPLKADSRLCSTHLQRRL